MAHQENGTNQPLRVVVFDNMRTRSHIFTRLFSQHPQLKQIYYPYLLPCLLGPERCLQHFEHSDRRRRELEEEWLPLFVKDTYGASIRKIEKEIADIEKTGGSVWVKQHCMIAMRQDIVLAHYRGHNYTSEDLGSNPTYYPDWLFDTCRPILVIRHPALSVRSLHQTMSQVSHCMPGDEDFHFCSTLRYCRMLFDLFRSQGRTPIVVDGDDVVWRTEEMTTDVCTALGIDPSGVKQHWPRTPGAERPTNPVIAGIYEDTEKPTGPIDIDIEVEKMVQAYGEEIAGRLRDIIEDNLADYEYLRQFKV